MAKYEFKNLNMEFKGEKFEITGRFYPAIPDVMHSWNGEPGEPGHDDHVEFDAIHWINDKNERLEVGDLLYNIQDNVVLFEDACIDAFKKFHPDFD